MPIGKRDYFVAGETLVLVKGRTGSPLVDVQELGLADDNGIRIRFFFKYKDVYIDDWGPDVPAEVLYSLSEAHVQMHLIHFNSSILQYCMAESMGGGTYTGLQGAAALQGPAGHPMISMGTPMGGGQQVGGTGNKFVSLNLNSGVLPWRFRAAYLAAFPLEWPMGTRASSVLLNWRCIPTDPSLADDSYTWASLPELLSSNAVLFDHTLDVAPPTK